MNIDDLLNDIDGAMAGGGGGSKYVPRPPAAVKVPKGFTRSNFSHSSGGRAHTSEDEHENHNMSGGDINPPRSQSTNIRSRDFQQPDDFLQNENSFDRLLTLLSDGTSPIGSPSHNAMQNTSGAAADKGATRFGACSLSKPTAKEEPWRQQHRPDQGSSPAAAPSKNFDMGGNSSSSSSSSSSSNYGRHGQSHEAKNGTSSGNGSCTGTGTGTGFDENDSPSSSRATIFDHKLQKPSPISSGGGGGGGVYDGWDDPDSPSPGPGHSTNTSAIQLYRRTARSNSGDDSNHGSNNGRMRRSPTMNRLEDMHAGTGTGVGVGANFDVDDEGVFCSPSGGGAAPHSNTHSSTHNNTHSSTHSSAHSYMQSKRTDSMSPTRLAAIATPGHHADSGGARRAAGPSSSSGSGSGSGGSHIAPIPSLGQGYLHSGSGSARPTSPRLLGAASGYSSSNSSSSNNISGNKFSPSSSAAANTSNLPASTGTSKTKCIRTVLAGPAYPRGVRSSVFSKCACSNLRCLSCNFKVHVFPGYEWSASADYLFFRNNAGNDGSLSRELTASRDSSAYCCQCTWTHTEGGEERTLLAQGNPKDPQWVCAGH